MNSVKTLKARKEWDGIVRMIWVYMEGHRWLPTPQDIVKVFPALTVEVVEEALDEAAVLTPQL